MSEQQVETPEVQEAPEFQARNFTLRATLQGHNAAVCSLSIDQNQSLLVSTSRDKTALAWNLHREQGHWAVQETRLTGHNHFVSSSSLTFDATHLVTSSWDGTLRLWRLNSKKLVKLFAGHKKDVLCTCFSPCNRIILSGGRDKTVKIWNILGEVKHSEDVSSWVTSIACAPLHSKDDPLTFAVGTWDGTVYVFELTDRLETKAKFVAHENARCTTVCFTPDGKWLLTGGSDRKVCMWSYGNKKAEKILNFTAPSCVNHITASPSRAWICAATYEGIGIWDIQARTQIDLVQPNFEDPKTQGKGRTPDCTCLAWATDGSVLYSGYNDGSIRAWEVKDYQ